MNKLDMNRTGLVVGSLMGVIHLAWVILVGLGGAQGFMDWIFRLHMITPPYQVLPFDLGSAVTLLVAVFVIGYAAGWVLAYIWNRIQRA